MGNAIDGINENVTFLTKWQGAPYDESTWEREADLMATVFGAKAIAKFKAVRELGVQVGRVDKDGYPLQLQPDGTVIAPAVKARAERAAARKEAEAEADETVADEDTADPADDWKPLGFEILTAQPEVLRLGKLHNYQVGRSQHRVRCPTANPPHNHSPFHCPAASLRDSTGSATRGGIGATSFSPTRWDSARSAPSTKPEPIVYRRTPCPPPLPVLPTSRHSTLPKLRQTICRVDDPISVVRPFDYAREHARGLQTIHCRGTTFDPR